MRALAYCFLAMLWLLAPLVLLSSTRLIPTLILGAIGYVYLFQGQWNRRPLWITFWVVLLFFRIDISFINRPGPPQILPYVIGLPSKKTMQKARRGEVVLHGCTATLLEPFWVVVW